MSQEKSYLKIPIGYTRVDDKPLENNTLFSSYDAALDYCQNNPTAYNGQIITVVSGERPKIYVITKSQTLGSILGDISSSSDQYKLNFKDVDHLVINHNMDYFPGVVVTTSKGDEIECLVEYITNNQIKLSWNGLLTGNVYLT